MSVEMFVVTPISSAAGTAARSTHIARRRATGRGSVAATTSRDRWPDRRTMSASATVPAAKTAKPIDHHRAWSGRSRFGSTRVGYAIRPIRLPAFEAANSRYGSLVPGTAANQRCVVGLAVARTKNGNPTMAARTSASQSPVATPSGGRANAGTASGAVSSTPVAATARPIWSQA